MYVEGLDTALAREKNHERVIPRKKFLPRDGKGTSVATKERDLEARKGLTLKRFFTKEGTHPFDEVEWETRDALIPNFKEGGNAFEQRGVEFPRTWSQNATNIVAQKYFRGQLGSPERESSVRQMIGRVFDTITGWGTRDGYFASAGDARVFVDELTHLL